MITASDVRVDHLAIARRYAERPDDWPRAPLFDPRQRWYSRIAVERDVEVWLLTWLPGQGTDLHDHGGSAGAFLVVAGELTEESAYVESDPRESVGRARLVARVLPTGAGSRFGPHYVHRVTNASGRPAVSVHVYGPALQTMTRYQLDGDRLRVAAIDRAGVGW